MRTFLVITTDSVCDLPESLVNEFGIRVCPYYVSTDHGRFMDEVELKADELLSHIALGKNGTSQPPSVEDYEHFLLRD